MRNVSLPSFLLAFVLVVLAGSVAAQRTRQRTEPTLTPAELQADLHQLRSLIERKHPAPYRYTDRDRVDRWFDSLHLALDTPLTARAFLASITTLYPLLGDGHTLFLPTEEDAVQRYLPIDVLMNGDSLFVRCDGPPGVDVHAGARIIALNGIPAQEVVHALLQRQIRDGYNMTYPRWIVGQWFRPYLRFLYGEPDHFDVVLRSAEGDVRTVRLPALPMDSIHERWIICAPTLVDGIRLSFTDSGVAVLRIPSFERSELRRDGFSAEDQLRKAFKELNTRQVQHLVLDLRGNQGGDPSLAKLLLAHLLSTPFRLVAEGPAKGTTRPVAEPYTGQLYTLMDGGCFSATGMVLAQLELHKRGALIGEEAGGERTVLSGSARTTVLRHSRISCTVSRRRWQLVEREHDGHGVVPTHPVHVSTADLIQGTDAVLLAAMELIRSAR